MKINYIGYECELEFANYGNGQTAITLRDVNDWDIVAVATVAIDDYVGESEVAIKNYSENEGILDILIEAGVVSEPKRFATSGFVTIPICDLFVDPGSNY